MKLLIIAFTVSLKISFYLDLPAYIDRIKSLVITISNYLPCNQK